MYVFIRIGWNQNQIYPDSWKKDSIQNHTYPEGLGTMIDKGPRFGYRRQNSDMPGIPFKDSSGTIIWGCRRKIPDRRIGKIQYERVDALSGGDSCF